MLVYTVHVGVSSVSNARTCSLMLLMPSGPRRFTACLTRSVRPQLSILKPRSCRNLASVEAASSFLVAQKQSSALQMETADPLLWLSGSLSQKWILRSVDIHLRCTLMEKENDFSYSQLGLNLTVTFYFKYWAVCINSLMFAFVNTSFFLCSLLILHFLK